MKNLMIILVFATIFCAVQAHALEDRLEVVQSRGIEQKFIFTRINTAPVAGVILIPGGHGKLNLSSSSGSVRHEWGKYDSVMRNRMRYAKQGFLVATIDAPSDRKKMGATWRMGEAHLQDIDAVAKFLKKQANVPIWVIGTSRGSFSAANAGIRQNKSINGIVLISPYTNVLPKSKIFNEFPKGIINMDLSKVTVPVFIISHKDDKCKVTPAENIDILASQFTSSVKVVSEVLSGGDWAKSDDPCGKGSAHIFTGIDEDLVNKISSFIKSN